jgi:N-acetylglucosaminyldiphosphoundecaprenol N-acetyl-beta-D-mannosaminyltransferase
MEILDIHIYNNSIPSAIEKILSIINIGEKRNLCISATGAHGIITAKKNNAFKEILNCFYINLPDGMPSVWVGHLKGAKNMERCYGPDFFKETIIATRDKNIKHFFCGGKEGVAEDLKKVCEEKFGNKNIVGTYSPPFRELSDDEIKHLAGTINSSGANIVWIGLSTPKQEIFAYRLSKYSNVNFICTVGAAFDFHTGKVKQAPKLIQKIGMEWFFRLIMEPKRLWKRYFEIVPLFIWYNLIEFINGDFFNKNIMEEY